MARVLPESFGDCFSKREFEKIYDETVGSFKDQFAKEDFLKEAETFHGGSADFKLKQQNQLEPSVKRYQWVDEATGRMIVTAYNTALEIIGIQFGKYESFESDKKTTVNKYNLPFMEEWFVLWGGTDSFLNYHYPYKHQRYAYDFIRKKEKDGAAFEGDQEVLSSYYAFGQPVTAPAQGKVVRLLTGIPDNQPNRMNLEAPEGNAIILDHGQGEYSLLAHLRNHSIMVKVGDEVDAHDVIAQCGNSGASETPHLHFHVMNGIEPHESESLRINFSDINEPVQGDFIQGTSL